VTVLEANGQIGGAYYLSTWGLSTEGESLEPGESMSVLVKFRDPSNKTISFTPVVEVGVGNPARSVRCDE
jgi:hypothetical protein